VKFLREHESDLDDRTVHNIFETLNTFLRTRDLLIAGKILAGHSLLHSDDEYFAKGHYLLGCGDCGELGCWPLQGRIGRKGNIVIWDSFSQPHRPLRDYSNFGPFLFDLEPYRTAVLDAAAHFRSG
jgi:hypothetical protein